VDQYRWSRRSDHPVSTVSDMTKSEAVYTTKGEAVYV
jgi:hypothetical protein